MTLHYKEHLIDLLKLHKWKTVESGSMSSGKTYVVRERAGVDTHVPRILNPMISEGFIVAVPGSKNRASLTLFLLPI